MNIIIDSDALLGLYCPEDAHNAKALKLTKKIEEDGDNVFILPTTLSEFALLASSRIGMEDTQKAVFCLTKQSCQILEITSEMVQGAAELYGKQASKEESLFDCFVMVAAKKLGIDYIFSFDKGYIKNGFNLLAVENE